MADVFGVGIGLVQRGMADLTEQEMVEQPAGLPNHAMWTVGHLVLSCQGILVELGAEPWLPDDWEATFGYGSAPVPHAEDYPAKDEMVALLEDAAARLRAAVLDIDDSVWERPLPDETFPTMGHLLLQVVVAHTAYHAGQLAVWRKAIGKGSAGVFV
jgi:hypothetical protein